MNKKFICFFAILTAVFFMEPFPACSASQRNLTHLQESAALQENGTDGRQTYREEADAYLNEIFDSVDFSDLDAFVNEGRERTTFSGLVSDLIHGGIGKESLKDIAEWAADALFLEITQNRKMLLEVVLIAFCFSILKNFAGVFQSSYTAEMCFVLVYCVLALMLLTSIGAFQEIVSGALKKSVEFMKALVPTFCISMIFSSNASSSLGFYQTAFLIIYLVEWIFLTFLLPMVHIYVLMELFNHFFEEDKFLNLAELFRDLIHWGIKIAGVAVLGLNVVQNLISPAKDRMAQGTLGRAASILPGVGGAVSSIGEILLGGGMVVKNCIGTAGIFMIACIGLIPMLKAACMAFFYKMAAAVTEPVTDKRIAGCLKGMSEGAMLYMKLLGYCMALFFLTIALTITATSFIF